MIDLQNIFYMQKRKSLELKRLSLDHRKAALATLKKSIESHELEILEALQKDFRKPAAEGLMTEIFPVMSELNYTLRNLKRWSRPKCVSSELVFTGTSANIYSEPKGTVLIISPWNYPFLLSIQPLISALAAGNTVMLKPSELTPHTSALMKRILAEIFPPEYVSVFEGDKTVSQELLKLPFDHIFFTGSTNVGQIVMQEAAKNLTPVTLELGGKSPVIITDDADLEDAAAKIIWGKVLNLAQTCVAPDYVFVPESKKAKFVELCLQQIRKQTTHHQLPLIISKQHAQRLQMLLKDAAEQGGKVSSMNVSDHSNPQEMGISLVTLTQQQAKTAKIMQEEIFGPLLPILSYEKLDEALTFLQEQERPLSLYIFSNDQQLQNKILAESYSGDVCINDVMIHFANHSLPIGGTGKSGMGQYHGAEGFRTFSHLRSVVQRQYFSKVFRLFYPPYKDFQEKIFRLLIKLGL